MPRLRDAYPLARSIWDHPENRRQGRRYAFADLVRWQLQKRWFGHPIIFEAFPNTKMIFHADSHLAGNFLYYGGYRDIDEMAFLSLLLRPGDLAIDVGANEGAYTLFMARCVYPEGRVIAIEPIPINIERLDTNLRLNGSEDWSQIVETVPAAVGEEEGFTMMTTNRAAGNTSEHILQRADSHLNSIRVRQVCLDDLASEDIAHLKVDVEGVEPLVLKGSEALLETKKILTLSVEYVPRFMRRYGLSEVDLLNFLSGHGYQPARFCAARRTLKLTGTANVDLDLNGSNALFVCAERMDEIELRLGVRR